MLQHSVCLSLFLSLCSLSRLGRLRCARSTPVCCSAVRSPSHSLSLKAVASSRHAVHACWLSCRALSLSLSCCCVFSLSVSLFSLPHSVLSFLLSLSVSLSLSLSVSVLSRPACRAVRACSASCRALSLSLTLSLSLSLFLSPGLSLSLLLSFSLFPSPFFQGPHGLWQRDPQLLQSILLQSLLVVDPTESLTRRRCCLKAKGTLACFQPSYSKRF